LHIQGERNPASRRDFSRVRFPMNSKVQSGLDKAGVAKAQRHLFFCLGPDCCRRSEGELLWDFVKRRIKELGVPVMRTKAECFRICAGGPWLVVYPEGIWYGGVTPSRFERILSQHIVGGEPVREWVAARNGCPASDLSTGCST
jgi:(2Fe-2S) ferredoxin